MIKKLKENIIPISIVSITMGALFITGYLPKEYDRVKKDKRISAAKVKLSAIKKDFQKSKLKGTHAYTQICSKKPNRGVFGSSWKSQHQCAEPLFSRILQNPKDPSELFFYIETKTTGSNEPKITKELFRVLPNGNADSRLEKLKL